MLEKMMEPTGLERTTEGSTEALNGLDESEVLEMEAMESLESTDEGEDAEAPALQDAPEAPENLEPVMDALQLTDSEKDAFRKIGTDVQGIPTENWITGYKRGSCYERLIPISD